MKKEIVEEFLKQVAEIKEKIKENEEWYKQYNEDYINSKQKTEIDKYNNTFSKLEEILENDQKSNIELRTDEFVEKSDKITSLMEPKEELISKVQSQNVITDLFGKLLDIEAGYQLDGNETKAYNRINKINNTILVTSIDSSIPMQDLNTAISNYSSMFSTNMSKDSVGVLDGNYQKRFLNAQSQLIYSNTKHECEVLNSDVSEHFADIDSYEEKDQKLSDKVAEATKQMAHFGDDKYSPSVIEDLDNYINLFEQQQERNIEMSEREKELVERMDKMEKQVDETVDKVVVLESEENLKKLKEQIEKLDVLAAGISDAAVVESFCNFIVTQLNQIEKDLTNSTYQEKGRLLGMVAELKMENKEVLFKYNELQLPLELRKKKDDEE